MFELKSLSLEAVPAALKRVERYRLLNEPALAESICRDVLRADPDNRQAQIDLLLSLTDQFSHGLGHFQEARSMATEIGTEYEQAYYSGIVCERRAHAHLHQRTPGSGNMVYNLLCEAMEFFEQAGQVRPADNDDAILRWNTCARVIMKHDHIQPLDEVATPLELE